MFIIRNQLKKQNDIDIDIFLYSANFCTRSLSQKHCMLKQNKTMAFVKQTHCYRRFARLHLSYTRACRTHRTRLLYAYHAMLTLYKGVIARRTLSKTVIVRYFTCNTVILRLMRN